MTTNDAITLDRANIVLPPGLFGLFEKAEAELKELYGVSPTVHDLICLWISCATSGEVRHQFEEAVLATPKRATKAGLPEL